MTQRNPLAVIGLIIITFGIYGIYWAVKTKGELNERGADIPTAWLIIVPFVNIWWLWKYSEGVEKVTNGKMTGIIAFILLFILDIIGVAIVQNEFNKLGETPATEAANPAGAGAPQQVAAQSTETATPAEETNQEPPQQQPPAQQPPVVQ